METVFFRSGKFSGDQAKFLLSAAGERDAGATRRIMNATGTVQRQEHMDQCTLGELSLEPQN
jgi:hypothetical protein